MAKFNRAATRPAMGRGPIVAEQRPTGVTFQGAPGYAREAKSELFLLAVANMVGEQTFYEAAGDRDDRFAALVHRVAVDDGAWMLGFLRWLRGEANMRSASLVAAAEAVRARLAAGAAPPAAMPSAAMPSGAVTNRALIDAVLQRPDEPGELLAYWASRYGRAIPKPVKRGVADAAGRLYTQRSLLKYDTGTHGFRFADVLELTHPDPVQPGQGDLFRHALDRRHQRAGETLPATLAMLAANRRLREQAAGDPTVMLDADRLREAGMTWEDALSAVGSRVDRARLWSALIPSMGFMAQLRNLRNFDEAGVTDDVAATVAARLADPAQVARSRQLPMRFLSAYRAAPSLRWSYPLEQALHHSLGNVPRLPGRTLVLVDTSGSMNATFAKDGTLKRWDAAVLFGVAVAQRCAAADVVSFSNATRQFPVRDGESLLASLERWRSDGYFYGGGTSTASALQHRYAGHDRVIVLTDEQAHGGNVDTAIPATVPMYTWNLAGYRYGSTSTRRNRLTFGGLTDQAFRMIPLIEAGRDLTWPWQSTVDRVAG